MGRPVQTPEQQAIAAARYMDSEERRRRIVEGRQKRRTFAALGKELGISEQRVVQIYRQSLARSPVLGFDDYRYEQYQALDALIGELWELARDTKVLPKDRVQAYAEIRGCLERQSKLMGLDAPSRSVVITLDVVESAIAALEAEESGLSRELQAGPAGILEGTAVEEDPPGAGRPPDQDEPLPV